jgi:hypothetical protein
MEFFHEHKHRASIRASESGPVEALVLSYDRLNQLLSASEPTRESLHQAADLHEDENLVRRGEKS